MSNLPAYPLEADWLLIWYPIAAAAGDLTEPRMRGGTAKFWSNQFSSGAFGGVSEQHITITVGDGGGGESGDPLSPNHLATASLIVHTTKDADDYFAIELEVHLGAKQRKQRLVVPPQSTTPFLLNLHAQGDDAVANTAVALQGVFHTGSRLGESDSTTIKKDSPKF